jgi:prevent-host-death family protein
MTVAGGRVMTKTVDVQEAQERLVELLAEVAEGVEVILTKDQAPLARIVSLDAVETPGNSLDERTEGPRIPGLHAGAGWISEDFDAPLPDDFWVETKTRALPRVPGLHPGTIWTSDDFDEPLDFSSV